MAVFYDNDVHHHLVGISKAEVNRFDLRTVRRKVWQFQQQDVHHMMFLATSLRRYNGARLIALIGLLTLILGIVLLSFAASLFVRIGYSEGMNVVNFTISSDLIGPFYVYGHISPFYGNSRGYMGESPVWDTYVSGFDKSTCGDYQTVNDLLKLRPGETMPEITGIPPDAVLTPCGMQSFTYFNDQFTIYHHLNCTNSESCIKQPMNIMTDNIAPGLRYALFSFKLADGARWTDPMETLRLQGWYGGSMWPNKLLLLGTLSDYVLRRGNYSIDFLNNVWPASMYGANKEIILVKLGPLGAQSPVVGYVAIGWGCALLLVAFAFWRNLKRDVIYSSAMFPGLAADQMKEQWIELTKEWMQRGHLFVEHSSSDHLN